MVESLRLAEFVAGVSLATDLGMGQPMEQGLRTCLVAVELGELAGLGRDERADIYYVALLRFLGCTADAHEAAAMTGGDDIALRSAIAPVLGGAPGRFMSTVLPTIGTGQSPVRRAALMAQMLTTGNTQARAGVRAHCEAGDELTARLGLPLGTREALSAAFERWNGKGLPRGIAGEEIPLAARFVFVARDLEVLARVGGRDLMVMALNQRRGAAYDPAVADLAAIHHAHLSDVAEAESPWQTVLAKEPAPYLVVSAERVRDVLTVFGDFADLKAPRFAGHSREVAALAAAAEPSEADLLHRVGLVQDLGRVGVPNGVWNRQTTLSGVDMEHLRLHPYYSERILGRLPATFELAHLAGMHHEHLDGSGYYRGVALDQIPRSARILAAADAYRSLTESGPDRPRRPPGKAADELARMATAGLMDTDAVDAVLAAAGLRRARPRPDWPGGLSEREVEVLRLICRGATKKDVADALTISPSTADHHVRHIYSKLDVTSRATATLFAVRHDLLG
jgi:HD-GYP domain-containing protein (c-di-GMP phosphodiesterase class II)/DNA-binding CsgD family transcriptional regulator